MTRSLVRRVALAALLATVAFGATGCFAFRRVETFSSEPKTETRTIPKDGTSGLDARFKMPAGVLNVDGDTDSLADLSFRSTNPDWLPTVSSTQSESASGTVTSLAVAVPDGVNLLRGTRNYEWDVHLATDVPSRLRFELGAGENDLDLRGMDVRSLRVTTGVGTTTIDLSGPRSQSLSAEITCGVGELTVRVPADVGVRISGRQEGIGNLTADGFTLNGEELTNDAWATATTTIEITLQRGIGDVRIETVD